MSSLTAEELIQLYQEIKERKETPVVFKDFKDEGVNQRDIRKAGFRGINDLKKTVGDEDQVVKLGKNPKDYVDREGLLEAVKNAYDEYDGFLMTVEDFMELTECGKLDLLYYFESFLELKKEAGVYDMERKKLFSRFAEELMECDVSRVKANDFLRDKFSSINIISNSREDINLNKAVKFVNNSDYPIKVSMSGSKTRRQKVKLFVKRTDMGFKEQIWRKYDDSLPDSVKDMFFEAVGKGVSPKGAASAIYWGLKSGITQRDAAEKFGASPVTLRNVRDGFEDMGYDFVVDGIHGPDGTVYS